MSESQTDMVQIENNGVLQEVSIEQLLGFNLQQVEEVRGFPLAPEGVYEWKILAWSNKIKEWTPKGTTETRRSMILDCQLEAIACRQTKDPEVDKTTLVGLQYTEGFFLSSKDDLGRVKSLFVDIGMTGADVVENLCDQSIGREFIAPITHRKDKNDTSKVYANLDRNAVEPLGNAEQLAPATPAEQLAPAGLNTAVPAPAAGGLSL